MLTACTFGVQAFNFEPITQDFTPEGKGSNQVFRAGNPGEEKIAVKISIRPRTIEQDGTEKQGAESGDFIIYPRRLILEPGESRSIRVKWTGDTAPAKELPFRIIAEQLPVAFSEKQAIEGAQITLTYRYEGNIYIVPPGAKAVLKINSIKRVADSEQEYLQIETLNTGDRHTLLNGIEVKLKRDENDSNPIILKDEQLRGMAGENMLAGAARIFRIPVPADLWEGPVYGSIKQ